MIPMYKLDKLPIAIVNKKYVDKADREVGDIAIGLMESIKESVNEKINPKFYDARVQWIDPKYKKKFVGDVVRYDNGEYKVNLGKDGRFEKYILAKEKDLKIVSKSKKKTFESVNEGKFYITRNLGRGQGKALVGGYDLKRDKKLPPKVFKSYKDAQKEVKRLERGGSMGGQMTAYIITDKDMNMLEPNGKKMFESVNKNINENTLGDLVKKYGKDLINFVIGIDELTKDEIKDVEYLDDRIQIHLEEPEIRQKYLPEGTCGYTPDGEPRSKPASPDMEEAIDLDIDDAHGGEGELDNAVARMGYSESLKKSLKEALNKRLGK